MGTTAEKLQKALANKQSLVDIVNSKAGTSYTINSKLSDIVETINTKWSSGSSATVEGNTLVVTNATVEDNTLTLSSGSVENNTLKL